MKREHAMKLRQMILKAVLSLSDDDAFEVPELFPRWKTDTAYAIGDRVCYDLKLYKCVQEHTSQASWTPDITPALWTEVSIDEFPEWRQPTGAQDAYMIGDKVSHNEKHWENTMDYNTYEPGVYGWNEVI